jgi:hypothetical protein
MGKIHRGIIRPRPSSPGQAEGRARGWQGKAERRSQIWEKQTKPRNKRPMLMESTLIISTVALYVRLLWRMMDILRARIDRTDLRSPAGAFLKKRCFMHRGMFHRNGTTMIHEMKGEL